MTEGVSVADGGASAVLLLVDRQRPAVHLDVGERVQHRASETEFSSGSGSTSAGRPRRGGRAAARRAASRPPARWRRARARHARRASRRGRGTDLDAHRAALFGADGQWGALLPGTLRLALHSRSRQRGVRREVTRVSGRKRAACGAETRWSATFQPTRNLTVSSRSRRTYVPPRTHCCRVRERCQPIFRPRLAVAVIRLGFEHGTWARPRLNEG